MKIDRFTQKSIEAIQNMEKVALDYGNQEIEQEHLLYSLLTIEDSIVPKLIEKMGIDNDVFLNRVDEALKKRTKVQGGKPYVGADLNKVLLKSEDEMKAMGDEYVSVEHILLAMLHYPNREIINIFQAFGIDRNRFLQALSEVRGNQKVTSDNPEATYDTLEKYGTELVAKAKAQKAWQTRRSTF